MDFLYFLLGVFGLLAAIFCGCIVIFDEYCDNRLLHFFLCIAGCWSVYYAITGDEPNKSYEARNVINANREDECRKVKLVTSEDGINLYVYQPRCGSQPVYFSKSGTQTTEIIRTGKTSREIVHTVPNTSGDIQ